jgi:TrmH family RNA methyltransferase
MDITSLQNPRIKHIVKLRSDRRLRLRDGVTLVEGADEINLAISSGLQPVTLFTAPEIAIREVSSSTAEMLTVDRRVFAKISFRENPDGCLAIFRVPARSLERLSLGSPALLVVAESLEKPGNLGAILRTADAAKVDAVVVCGNPVDLWNPNVIRASRGTIFTVPALEVENGLLLEWLRSEGIRVVATSSTAVETYTETDLRGPTAVVVGAEDSGLSAFWLEHSDVQVRIPMLGAVNSLNVSVATALLVYEAVRQRQVTRSRAPIGRAQ